MSKAFADTLGRELVALHDAPREVPPFVLAEGDRARVCLGSKCRIPRSSRTVTRPMSRETFGTGFKSGSTLQMSPARSRSPARAARAQRLV